MHFLVGVLIPHFLAAQTPTFFEKTKTARKSNTVCCATRWVWSKKKPVKGHVRAFLRAFKGYLRGILSNRPPSECGGLCGLGSRLAYCKGLIINVLSFSGKNIKVYIWFSPLKIVPFFFFKIKKKGNHRTSFYIGCRNFNLKHSLLYARNHPRPRLDHDRRPLFLGLEK